MAETTGVADVENQEGDCTNRTWTKTRRPVCAGAPPPVDFASPFPKHGRTSDTVLLPTCRFRLCVRTTRAALVPPPSCIVLGLVSDANLHNLVLVHRENLLLRERRLVTALDQRSLCDLSVSSMICVKLSPLTSTSTSDPAAANPTDTGKKASASPSHLNSRLPEELSLSTVSIVQMKAFRSARQSASPVTDGKELGLGSDMREPGQCVLDPRDRDGDDDVAEGEVLRLELVLDGDVGRAVSTRLRPDGDWL